FVTKLDAAGSTLLYSTYLGGNNTDWGRGIAVDAAGNADVTGLTKSLNFPTAQPVQPAFSILSDAFVTKLDAAGSTLLYSTSLGGSSDDSSTSIAVDLAGHAYVTGGTTSPDFPMVNPVQPAFSSGVCNIDKPCNDAFVAKIAEIPPNCGNGVV